MKLYFGHGLDGPTWFPEFDRPTAIVGEAVTGPLGLLRRLETAAGTSGPEIAEGRRVIAYLKSLRAADTSQRFYHGSFEADPLAVARHLLGVRDELRMAGWDGKPIKGLPRIDDLASAEKGMESFPGIAARLYSALALLERHKKKPFESIALAHPHETFEALWETALKRLAALGVTITQMPQKDSAQASPSDLASLRKRLSAAGDEKPKGDETFRLLEGSDPWTAARWTAAWTANLSADKLAGTLFIVPSRYAACLADAFRERGIPFGMASSAASFARPAFQTLLIALILAWDPPDPESALSLLHLPDTPFYAPIRRVLIRALRESPAVASREWTQNLPKALQALTKGDDGGAQTRKTMEERVKEWFTPCAKRADGISLDALMGILKRIVERARVLYQTGHGNSWLEAAELAKELSWAAPELGLKAIPFERLLRLAREMAGDGLQRDSVPPASGGPHLIGGPEAVLGTAETVVWWDFSAGTMPTASWSIWSNADRAKLAGAGVLLPSPFEIAQRRAAFWPAPLLAATNRFLAVTFERDQSGRSETSHPLLDLLLPADRAPRKNWLAAITVKPGVPESPLARRFEKETKTLQESPTSVWKGAALWQIGPNPLPKADHPLKADSLQRGVSCGLAFALADIAGLKGNDLLALSEENQLYGRIAHKVFERVFPLGQPTKPDQAEASARQFLRDNLKKMASNLAAAEGQWEAMDLADTIANAARGYAEFLLANDLEIMGVEARPGETLIDGIAFRGQMDQILGRKGRLELIIDLKWSGVPRRRDELRDGNSIQLALYARLVQPGGTPLEVGYYMLRENVALVLSDRFKNAEKVQGPAMNDVLQQALVSFGERLKLNGQGSVPAEAVNQVGQARWEPSCDYCDYDLFCGKLWLKRKKKW